MFKLRHLTTLLLMTIMIFIMSACGEENGTIYPDGQYYGQYEEEDQHEETINLITNIVFEPTEPRFRTMGYNYFAEINDIQYFFAYNDERANLAFINANERLIYEVSSLIDLGRPPRQFFLAASPEVSLGVVNIVEVVRVLGETNNGISFTHGCSNTMGWLVHVWSDGDIPMWLSAGIEAVALSNAGKFETRNSLSVPQNFGDFLLSPGNWGTPAQAQTIDTAYHFVRHLIEIDAFDEVMALLVSRDKDTIEATTQLLNTHFYEFSDGIQISPIQYTLFDRHGIYNITKFTEKANYIFSFPAFYRYMYINNMARFIAFTDDGIQFVYDWFARHFDFEFSPIIIEVIYSTVIGPNALLQRSTHIQAGGRTFSANRMVIWYFARPDVDNSMIVHEAVHAMDRQAFGVADPLFAEGLAQALTTLHSIAESDNFGERYSVFIPHFTNPAVMSWFKDLLIDIFGSQSSANYFMERFIMNFDQIGLAHFRAYRSLYHWETIMEPYDAMSWWRKHPGYVSLYIASYVNSESFVLYLLETYGDEKYAQVHYDLDNFENVYGMTLHEMIEQWRGFLRDFADEIRAAG